MAALGNGPMHGDDIAMMGIRDPAIGADVAQDMADHYAVVVLRLLGLARQVLGFVALGQLGHGRRLAPLAPSLAGSSPRSIRWRISWPRSRAAVTDQSGQEPIRKRRSLPLSQ